MVPADGGRFTPVVVTSDGGVPRATRSDAGADGAVIDASKKRLKVLARMIDRRAGEISALYDERAGLFVTLRDDAGLSLKQIATLAGCTESAVIQKYQKVLGIEPKKRPGTEP